MDNERMMLVSPAGTAITGTLETLKGQARIVAGSARKASIVAYSIGSYCVQMPVRERKSGIPLSVETPAPVRTTHGCASTISAARCSADTT